MARQLFGTDGIRGVAGEYPLDRPTAYVFGMALGEWATRHTGNLSGTPTVLLGMDTRESGPWLAEHVAGGLAARGVAVRFAGVITTPGVAYLTRTGPFTAGVMISASHNPYQDNGLKVFDHSGFKLPDSDELGLEQSMFALAAQPQNRQPLALTADEGLDQQYLNFLAGTMAVRLSGLSLVLDCANGAASLLAPELFTRLGADVHAISHTPNGQNINEGCGALHVERLRQTVQERGADLGIAFDGDADRAILVSHSGKIIDGDHVLLIIGTALHAKGDLNDKDGQPTVVATVMSNLGLQRALEQHGIRMLRTAVGDKYVLEEMQRQEAAVGGEQSGHVIFRHHATTGDGMLTALQTLQVVCQSGHDLDALTQSFAVYPQKLVNVRVKAKRPLDQLPLVQAAIQQAEQEFDGLGRVLVRFSGTEPLARVMIEGQEQHLVDTHCERIAETLRKELSF